MRTITLSVFVVLLSIIFGHADNLTTVGGKTYADITIVSNGCDGVSICIRHRAGTSMIPYATMQPADQAKYGYNTDESKALLPQEEADAVTPDLQAENILREVDVLQKAGKYRAATARMRQILPLCPQLSTPRIIEASQVLDAMLLKWDSVVSIDGDRDSSSADLLQPQYPKRTYGRRQLNDASDEVYDLRNQLASVEEKLRYLNDPQSGARRQIGSNNARIDLQKKATSLQAKIEAAKNKAATLRSEQATAEPERALYTVQPVAVRPTTTYSQLGQDFHKAISTARKAEQQRDKARRQKELEDVASIAPKDTESVRQNHGEGGVKTIKKYVIVDTNAQNRAQK